MENENSPVIIKETLYDKIFKPQRITLANGHSVLRRRSRAPLIIILLAAAIYLSLIMTGFDIGTVINKFSKMLDLLKKILQPDWSFFPKVISPLFDTIKMSILGTVIGCALALPIAILSSSNINHSVVIVSICRFILALIRTLPTLIIALVCALIFSLGTFSGTVAIALFTFGIVAKMLFESIETIDMGPFEAMEALGANKFQAFWSACVPQILPVYLSHSLYCFEMNVRASAILGYVGAGGLGITINERIGWRDYESLGMVLLSLFVVVVAIDFFSENIGEDPYSDIYVVPFDLNGGMEYPGLIMINKAYFKSSKSTEGALVMGHETAHQWFYGVVGSDQVYSPWLDESLVEYLGFDFLRQYAGTDAADALEQERYYAMRNEYLRTKRLDGSLEELSGADYFFMVYAYGHDFYAKLVDEIGAGAFYEGLKTYYNANYMGIGTKEKLIAAFSEAAGRDLTGWFEANIAPEAAQ